MSSTILCFAANFASTSSPVAYWPVFVFFAFGSIFKISNKTSPNCFGDARLKRTPACSNTRSSLILISDSNTLLYSFKNCSSTFTPSNSISTNTCINGFSTSSKTRFTSRLVNKGSKHSFNWKVISASSAAYSVIWSNGTSRIVPWFFPFFPIRVWILTGAYPKNCSLRISMLRVPSGSIT